MKCNCSQYTKPIETINDITSRCKNSSEIKTYLQNVAIDSTRWFSINKCTECGKYWAEEYPFGERHGGGSACYYQVETKKPDKWLKENSPITHSIRKRHENNLFIKSLGKELGPKKCKKENCNSLRVSFSVMCKKHHFEMIKKKPYPF